MGERKGVNKYYPPDWDPSKGSINEYVGQHPLRDRARKLGQGILIIRFEMPYNIWCGGCNSHIGMGVRYNAEKTKAGMYYTTPIYKFRMKCHLCDNHFEIQTDPKNHDYVILEGARRKEQRWDPTENGQIATEDKAVQKKMVTDAMFKLEHGSDDVQKGKKAKSNLGSLEVRRDEWKDDYMLNKIARQKFRDEKKAIKAEVDSDNALLVKSSLDIPLQKETEDDVKLAGLIKYRALESYDERQAEKRKEIESRPLFDAPNKSARLDVASPDNKKLDIIKKHLRTAKANNHISPFDRTTMNTLGTNISKQSLGIRKRKLPKLPNPVFKPSDVNVGLSNSEIVSHAEVDEGCNEEISDDVKPLHNHTDQDERTVNNSNSCDNIKVIQHREQYLSCTTCDKSVREKSKTTPNTVKLTEQTNSSSSISDNKKVSVRRHSNVTDVESSYNKVISESNNCSNEGSCTKSALSLVCDYSDTDSDT